MTPGIGSNPQELITALEDHARSQMMSIARPGLLTRAVDSLVGVFSPSALADRQEARTAAAMAVFQAAEVSRLTTGWDAPETSGDGALLPDAGLMNARARASKRDNWAVASISDSYRRDVGCMKPRAAAIDLRTDKKLDEFNRKVDFWWRRWAMKPGYCDFYKQQSLTDLIGLVVEEAVQTGQGFVVPSIDERGGPVPLVLQLFEFEELAVELVEAENGNEIKLGVEVDADGVAVAYWFHTRGHRLDGVDSQVTRIPAERVLRLAQVDRVRSVLASSILSPVLRPARALDSYLQFEDRAKHLAACASLQLRKDAGYKGKPGSAIGMGAVASKASEQVELKDANGRTVKRMESGTIYDPPPGTYLESVESKSPNQQFTAYTDKRETHIAAGAGRSASSMTRKYTASYTAERRGEVEDHKGNRLWHERSVTQVLGPIRELFIDLLIVTGKVKVPAAVLRDPSLREGLYETEWMPPRREPLDPSRDAASKKIRLDYKLDNRGRILNEEGRDWHDNFDDIAEQAAYAEERDIPLPEMSAGGSGAVSTSEARPRGESNSPDGTGGDEGDAKDKGGDEEGGDEEAMIGVGGAGGVDDA